jgi:hypothetical protein
LVLRFGVVDVELVPSIPQDDEKFRPPLAFARMPVSV